MVDLNVMRGLVSPNSTKIVMIVVDGVGGAPMVDGGPTELEAAHTPNLDELAARSVCGLHDPIGAGITPGSGPSHLALFGYDPIRCQIGRGVLEAVGIEFPMSTKDVASRGNFCSVDVQGRVTDRRAGRIPTEVNERLCEILRTIELQGARALVETVKEHRFIFVLRGEGLSGDLTETDPQQLGVKPLPVEALTPKAERTAVLVNQFIEQARRVLVDQRPANMILLRGFSVLPDIPTMQELFGLKAASIAVYPMYRGVASLVGMEALSTGPSIAEEFDALEKHLADYDFFYLHVKGTDSAGEDGDFNRKVAIIEEVDEQIPRLMALDPNVVIVTGDHSSPAVLRSHSWHPVPVLIYSRYCRPDVVKAFSETGCTGGALGRFPAVNIMRIAMANALRLTKYGA